MEGKDFSSSLKRAFSYCYYGTYVLMYVVLKLTQETSQEQKFINRSNLIGTFLQ